MLTLYDTHLFLYGSGVYLCSCCGFWCHLLRFGLSSQFATVIRQFKLNETVFFFNVSILVTSAQELNQVPDHRTA